MTYLCLDAGDAKEGGVEGRDWFREKVSAVRVGLGRVKSQIHMPFLARDGRTVLDDGCLASRNAAMLNRPSGGS